MITPGSNKATSTPLRAIKPKQSTVVKVLIKRLEKHRKAIGNERDELRKLVVDANSFLMNLEEGHFQLSAAIDTLSEQA